jgi:hypothetical protein
MQRTLPIAVLILLALLPGTAAAAWRAEPVPAVDTLMVNDLGFDAFGRGLLTVEGFGRKSPRKFTGLITRTTDGQWVRQPNLKAFTWGNARTNLYGSDRALLVAMKRWRQTRFNRATFDLVVAFGTSDGKFGKLVRLDRDGSNPVSDVNARGDAVVAWSRALTGRVIVALRAARHRFGKARRIGPKGAIWPAVAVNARGDVIVAWARRRTVEARIKRAGRPFGKTLRVGRAGRDIATINAAMGPTGEALVTYGAVDRPPAEEGPYELEHGVGHYDGARFRSSRLDRFSLRNYGGVPSALPVFDPKGRALVGWVGADDTKPETAFRLAQVTAERFTVIASLPAGDATLDDLAVSGKGAIAATWNVLGGATGPFVAVSRDGTTFPPATDLHEAGSTSLAPSAVAFRFETPVVTWTAVGEGPRTNVRAAVEE